MRKEIIGAATLYLGDCLGVLKAMPDNSVDSIVTDPPYGLTSARPGGRSPATKGAVMRGFMGLQWDGSVPSVEIWAECLRVLKPGGHLLAFAGTRTQHRMAVCIEDAGFEIRDMIAWVYGSGFPKSLNVANAIHDAAIGQPQGGAKPSSKNHGKFKSGCSSENETGRGFGAGPGQFMVEAGGKAERDLVTEAITWQGWGTALKPALEPITVARKPLVGTVAANVLAHGTGALNIDGCRVPTNGEVTGGSGGRTVNLPENVGAAIVVGRSGGNGGNVTPDSGRWPANLIHDGSEDVLAAFPQAPGQLAKAAEGGDRRKTQSTYGVMARGSNGTSPRADSGSAARFFYCAKASKNDRGEGNAHPTVKPTELMRYLCRLVTPPCGTVLDPFMGSGSTGKAALLEGFAFIGAEREQESFDTAAARIGFTRSAHIIAAAEVTQMELI